MPGWAPGLKYLNNNEASLTWLVLRVAICAGKNPFFLCRNAFPVVRKRKISNMLSSTAVSYARCEGYFKASWSEYCAEVIWREVGQSFASVSSEWC